MNWRAIIFDLDDTLYPERDYVRSGFRQVAKWCSDYLEVSADTVFRELSSLFDSGMTRNTFNQWLEDRGLPRGLVSTMIDVYRGHNPCLEPYPGVRELLERIGSSCKVGLLSDGPLSVQERKFAALRIEKHFDSVVFSDQWGRDHWKPALTPYLAALEELAEAPCETVYVADNPLKDFIACRKLGMSSIRVRNPHGIYAATEPVSPEDSAQYVVQSVADIIDIERGAQYENEGARPI